MTALRVVEPGEKLRRRRAKTIVEAAAAGDQLELLRAMRSRVARAVQDPNCPPRDLAALSRRLQEIMREIAELESERAKREAEDDAVGSTDERWDEEAL